MISLIMLGTGFFLFVVFIVLIRILIVEINKQHPSSNAVAYQPQTRLEYIAKSRHQRIPVTKAPTTHTAKPGASNTGLPLFFVRDPEPSCGGSVKSSTERQLLSLLRGDRPTASRLLEQSRSRHLGKTEQWHWEKVIYDLERDRRA